MEVAACASTAVATDSLLLCMMRMRVRAGEKSTNHFGLLGDIDQKSVMAVIGGELTIRDIAVATAEGADDFERLVAGIEPIGRKTNDEEARLHVLQSFAERGAAVAEIEVIHRFSDIEVRVGIKAIDELRAPVAEVTFYLEVDGKIEAYFVFAAQAAAEFFAHRVITHVSDVADHAGDG